MKLYAIRYAKNFKYGLYGAVYRNAENPGQMLENFPFFYYIAELEGKYILIDTGFRDEQLASDKEVTLLSIEKEIEHVFGEMPPISKVILTHSHWDHVNNLDLYQGVPVVMAKQTYSILMGQGEEAIKQTLQNTDISFVEDCAWIDDKFHFQIIGGHTTDSSVIYFEEAGKKYVITGDECYLCDNAKRNIPIGVCEDEKKNEEFVDKIHQEKWIPLPFHDEEVMEKYHKLSENIVQVI